MKFRHELKHEISYMDLLVVRQRLKLTMKKDLHATDGKYCIRSLYFDTPSDKALREKLDGVSRREKFRIRYYNGETSVIRLEKKSKFGGLGSKCSVMLSRDQAQNIIEGKTEWILDSKEPLLREFYSKAVAQRLEPKTIVEYTREPFVYPTGNVRVTLDYNIRTKIGCSDFWDQNCATIAAAGTPIIMEVKWDEFLPSFIRDAVQLESRRSSAFSKYAQCRVYG